MKTNIGNMDRLVRAVLGVALIGATLSGLIGVWGWIGVVLVGTAFFSFCPVYGLLGINSCRTSPEHKPGA